MENAGSCPLIHDGRQVSRATLAPGDTLELRNELLFLCVRRAPIVSPPAVELAAPLHPFGGPDAFGIVGESPRIWELRRQIYAVARHEAHVLILGASGVGKELVARAVHARSSRGARPLVTRNAATIPEGLVDAELFGNAKGYPHPGMPERRGLIGEAHASSLFLDEIAELPQGLQAHLLRVMDDGDYHLLGESTTRRSDLRLLAATNRPESDLKHDVLARLKIRLLVPDLNARRDDIPLLVVHLLRRHAAADPVLAARFFPDGDPRGAPRISPVLMLSLVQRRYTTHLRELETQILGATLEGSGRYLELPPTPPRAVEPDPPAPPATDALAPLPAETRAQLSLLRQHRFNPAAAGRDPAYPGNRQTADLHLRQLLCRALQLAGWDLTRAAALLAGDGDVDLRDKVAARLEAFVSNLRARIAGETEAELRRALTEQWKGHAGALLEVVDALRAGRVS